MIVSASRRTDIPALYSNWFMKRVRDGFCDVVNPFNARQVSRVSLRPEDVDLIVFWTRNPRPLLRHLGELDARGFKYYFQYTVMNNPRSLDPHTPPLEFSLATFQRLAEAVGHERIFWRYDPIVLTSVTGRDFHVRAFERIARQLARLAHGVVVSVVDAYDRTGARLRALQSKGVFTAEAEDARESAASLLRELGDLATAYGIDIQTCAEPELAQLARIREGKCIDEKYILTTFGLRVRPEKDRSQRKGCRCVVSKDIGAYETCALGCAYCYAVWNPVDALRRFRSHDPRWSCLGSPVTGCQHDEAASSLSLPLGGGRDADN